MINETGYGVILPHQTQELLQATDALYVEAAFAFDDLGDERFIGCT